MCHAARALPLAGDARWFNLEGIRPRQGVVDADGPH
jgi:hypothetical protein